MSRNITGNRRLEKLINATARKALAEIAELSDEDIEDLPDYLGDSGFPLSFDVTLGSRGAVHTIEVSAGHHAWGMWHGIEGLLEAVRGGDLDRARAYLIDDIEIAISNERDASSAA